MIKFMQKSERKKAPLGAFFNCSNPSYDPRHLISGRLQLQTCVRLKVHNQLLAF